MADVNLDRVLARIDTHEDARNKKEVNELKSIGDKLDRLNDVLLDISESLGNIASSLMIEKYELRVWTPTPKEKKSD